ncbi:MAG: type II toxin-antitoxin system RelB/DinJ family antitoxin [bacterium]|nr:type II toxin-antitoxin system RelB/DinJ family antitoxin [bacterium]
MNTTLTIKTNKKLRNAAKKTAEEMGVPLTTVVNAMLKQFVRDKEIILSVRTPNAETRRAMGEARERKNIEAFESLGQWKKRMQLR